MLNSNHNSNGTSAGSKTPQQLAARMSQPRTLNIGVHLFYSKLLGEKVSDADATHQKAVLETLHLLDEKALGRTILAINGYSDIEKTAKILVEAGINTEPIRCIVTSNGEIDKERYVYTLQSKGSYSNEKFDSSQRIWNELEGIVLFGCTELCVGQARNSLLAMQKEKGGFQIDVPKELLLLSFQYWGSSHLLTGF